MSGVPLPVRSKSCRIKTAASCRLRLLSIAAVAFLTLATFSTAAAQEVSLCMSRLEISPLAIMISMPAALRGLPSISQRAAETLLYVSLSQL